MSLHRALYSALLNGRSNFIDFYWGLWRDSMMVNICILWRFLVTWIHANILTAHLMRELFPHQGLYLLHLVLWRFPRMFSGFARLLLQCQTVPCYLWYHRRFIALHRRMWKQWLLRSFFWIYSFSLPLYLYRCVSSA